MLQEDLLRDTNTRLLQNFSLIQAYTVIVNDIANGVTIMSVTHTRSVVPAVEILHRVLETRHKSIMYADRLVCSALWLLNNIYALVNWI